MHINYLKSYLHTGKILENELIQIFRHFFI